MYTSVLPSIPSTRSTVGQEYSWNWQLLCHFKCRLDDTGSRCVSTAKQASTAAQENEAHARRPGRPGKQARQARQTRQARMLRMQARALSASIPMHRRRLL